MGFRWLRCIALTAVVAAAATGCGGGNQYGTAEKEAVALQGGVLRPPNVEPSFTLTDTSGAPYDLESSNPGKVTLVYFGYTHCPDVCPTTMADIAQALRESTPEVRRAVTVIFVTVDPRRDSLKVVREWLNQFNPAFVGLRGSLQAVIAAQKAANLPVSKVLKNGKEIEHAAQVLAFTPDHRAHVIYFQGPSTIEDLKHDLPILTTGQGFGA